MEVLPILPVLSLAVISESLGAHDGANQKKFIGPDLLPSLNILELLPLDQHPDVHMTFTPGSHVDR